MTHMIVGEIEKVDMEVEDASPKISMQAHSTEDVVTMGSPVAVVSRIEKDYDRLNNRPSINEHLLVGGENSLSDLGIELAKNADITRLFS